VDEAAGVAGKCHAGELTMEVHVGEFVLPRTER
jgi:hypothetical protein